MSPDDDAYARGLAAGEINARLSQHDHHFADINGSIAKLVTGVSDLVLQIQKLSDGMIARDDKVIATTIALREAEQARHNEAEAKWSTWQKIIGALSAFAALGTILAVTLTLFHP